MHVTSATLALSFAGAALGLFLAAAPATQATSPTIKPGGKPPEGVTRLALYDNTPGVLPGRDTEGDPRIPTIDLYPLLKDTSISPPPTAAVVILPGGGYVNLSTTREGTDIARLFNAHGVAAFVIRYRHAPRYRSPIPLQDAQRGIRWVRAHATEYNIDAEKIGVIGFSAGGHDAAEIAVATDTAGDPKAADPIERESAKADFAVLAYPVINLSDPSVAHHGSRDALTGGNSALFAPLSPEQHVTSSTPPCFITAGADDRVVPIQNSILFFEACRAAHVPAELHVWEHGSHGFSLGNNSENRQWPTLMFNWLAINKFIPANSTSAR